MDMQVRLTEFSHGGGCGCKIAPGVLEQILAKAAPGLVPKQLLVGIETADDAAVYQINDTQAIVATTDFFMPIVDDPFDFGAIAATNAISDVYAMGGHPLFALALVGMPVSKIPLDVIRRILEGGESVCARAGIPIAGGHTIDSVEPIYGLVAIGLVDPRNLKRNAGAKAGDKLVLGKPLGVGIYSAALKKGRLDEAGYRGDDRKHDEAQHARARGSARCRACTRSPTSPASDCSVTCSRSARVRALRRTWTGRRFPCSPARSTSRARASPRAHRGATSRATATRWRSAPAIDDAGKALLTDPQTSGGLLVSCAPGSVDEVLRLFADEGFAHAAVIGEIASGQPAVRVD